MQPAKSAMQHFLAGAGFIMQITCVIIATTLKNAGYMYEGPAQNAYRLIIWNLYSILFVYYSCKICGIITIIFFGQLFKKFQSFF